MTIAVYFIGSVALLNCLVGLLTGNMYYFFKAPDEFLGAVRSISRASMPVAFWAFFAITLGFGLFVLHFAQTAL